MRQPRADAVRNRGRILSAARQEIASRGPDVGMDEIASHAGVAVGTVYRHFPTKEALVTAVVDEYTEQVADAAERRLALCQGGAPANEQLDGFIRDLITVSADNRAAKAAAEALGGSQGAKEAEARASSAIARLIECGHQTSSIPRHVTVADVYLLVGTAPYDQPASTRDRWLDLMLTGLMAPAPEHPDRSDPADRAATG